MGDKPVLSSVTWSHTIFGYFILFPNVSRNKLPVRQNFMILGTTDQKLWVFEVLRRSLGQGGHVLEPIRKSWPHEQKMGAGRRKRGGGGALQQRRHV
jgi:hypothetical protein